MSEIWGKLITIFVLLSLFVVIYCRVMNVSIVELAKEIWELMRGGVTKK
jgi:hypothetical protein